MASGAQKIYDEMVRLCEGIDGVEIEMQKDIPHVGVIKTGCQGLCELGPLVRIEPYGYQYVHVQGGGLPGDRGANCTPWTSCRSSVLPPWR